MRRRLVLWLLLLALAAPVWGQASRDCTTANVIVNCGDANALEGVTALTVAAWVQGDTDSTFRWIAAKWSSTVATSAWSFGRTTSLDFAVASGSTQYSASGTTAVQTNTAWYCLVGTFDAARTDSVELEAWVNGVREGQGAGPNAAINAVTQAVGVCNRVGGGATTDWEEEISDLAVEARAWSETEIIEYCRGNLVQAQRAAGGTGGYLPFRDNAADPGTYTGLGAFAGVCSATTDPAASAVGPPAFIPGSGQ